MLTTGILGYLLAISVALSGASGTRLQKSGELTVASRTRPLATLVMTILYGLSGFATLFYFSWAYLEWPHIVTFFVVIMFLTSWIAKSKSRLAVWSVFVVSVLVALTAEVLLLNIPN